MDMAILFGVRQQTHAAIGSEGDTRSLQPRWRAFVIAFGIGATFLWAGTLLWLASWTLLLMLARHL
jgi:hypothetical protein